VEWLADRIQHSNPPCWVWQQILLEILKTKNKVQILNVIMEKCPSAVFSFDNTIRCLLTDALMCGSRKCLIQAINVKAPDLALMQNVYGHYALHTAVLYNNTVDVLSYLIELDRRCLVACTQTSTQTDSPLPVLHETAPVLDTVPVGLTALAVALYVNITRTPATVNAEPTADTEAMVHNSSTTVVSRVNSSASTRDNCICIIQFFVTTHPIMHMLLDRKNNSPLALFLLGDYSAQHTARLLHVFLMEYQNAHHGLAMLMLDENNRIPLFAVIS